MMRRIKLVNMVNVGLLGTSRLLGPLGQSGSSSTYRLSESVWAGPDPQDVCGIFGPVSFFDGGFFRVKYVFGPSSFNEILN